jgi:predicted esterase
LGCGDYQTLMQARIDQTASNKIENHVFLPAFQNLLKETDVLLKTLKDKHILMINGEKDNLVPLHSNQAFLANIAKNTNITFQYELDQSVGHEVTEWMENKVIAYLNQFL